MAAAAALQHEKRSAPASDGTPLVKAEECRVLRHYLARDDNDVTYELQWSGRTGEAPKRGCHGLMAVSGADVWIVGWEMTDGQALVVMEYWKAEIKKELAEPEAVERPRRNEQLERLLGFLKEPLVMSHDLAVAVRHIEDVWYSSPHEGPPIAPPPPTNAPPPPTDAVAPMEDDKDEKQSASPAPSCSPSRFVGRKAYMGRIDIDTHYESNEPVPVYAYRLRLYHQDPRTGDATFEGTCYAGEASIRKIFDLSFDAPESVREEKGAIARAIVAYWQRWAIKTSSAVVSPSDLAIADSLLTLMLQCILCIPHLLPIVRGVLDPPLKPSHAADSPPPTPSWAPVPADEYAWRPADEAKDSIHYGRLVRVACAHRFVVVAGGGGNHHESCAENDGRAGYLISVGSSKFGRTIATVGTADLGLDDSLIISDLFLAPVSCLRPA
jgi:hypothetical protein